MPLFFLGAATVLGSGLGAAGSALAGNEQAGAAKKAASLQQQMFDQTQANLAPFVQSGQTYVNALKGALGLGGQPFDPSIITSTPGYQFATSQGIDDIINARTATGGVGGGNTLKAITQFGQGLASTQLQQYINNLLSGAGLSESAAAGQGQISAGVGSNIANQITGAGNASAAGLVGGVNAITGGINSLASNYLLSSLLGGGGGIGGGSLESYLAAAPGFGG